MVSPDPKLLRDATTGLVLDLSNAPALSLDGLDAALAAMARIEAGAIANPDEGRQVGHYWLRAPELAPPDLADEIRAVWERLRQVEPAADVVWIGIGGSALGPQMLAQAIGAPFRFMDNTDPEGFFDPGDATVVVVSKSGTTPETAHAMDHAGRADVVVTGAGSKLDRPGAWPIWDWVGGRTSITGPVGLLILALAGADWEGFLAGARDCDVLTRKPGAENPAALLAAAWRATDRDLVFLPYRDRFALLGRYLQQLIMESIGKRLDRSGTVVQAGLTVYGNKGSTDQHAFVQQLRDGKDDALVHLVDAFASPGGPAGDALLGMLLGTGQALADAGRPTITLTVRDTSLYSLGVLVALFERATGLYAELIDINAYHQPGVEAGKKAAKKSEGAMVQLAEKLSERPETAKQLSELSEIPELAAWRLLHHLAATGRAAVEVGGEPLADRFKKR